MTSNLRSNPFLYEINTFTFLTRLSQKYGSRLTLSTIPGGEWQYFVNKGFDLIWLMGVWQRSPLARQMAINNIELRKYYNRLLPNWKETDIGGSAFAIYDYKLDKFLGDEGELGKLKEKLNSLGMKLILDFVPNHLALDHPWTKSHTTWFIRGNKMAIQKHPQWYYMSEGGVPLAHGRDPYFPAWNDTVQVNFFSKQMRQAMIGELLKVAAVADGVRCDMAMLAINGIFEKVWGEVLKTRIKPESEFWAEAIPAVKSKNPDFLFMAEAYWGTEGQLRQLGFDYTYDKTYYDRLKYSSPAEIKEYIQSRVGDIGCGVHFIENHDEERVISLFGRERSLAAAVAISTIPGIRFLHDGQMEGKWLHIPVQMSKEPYEPVDDFVQEFYYSLLRSCRDDILHDGKWKLLSVEPMNPYLGTHVNLLAWSWEMEGRLKLVVINYSSQASQGRVKLPVDFKGKETVSLFDELAEATYQSPAREVEKLGLYVSLSPWQSHILDIIVS